MNYQSIKRNALLVCDNEELNLTQEMKFLIKRDKIIFLTLYLQNQSCVTREFVKYLYRQGVDFKVKALI